MCSECLHTPCHPRCPNADIPLFFRCMQCGDDIDGAIYYKDNEYNFFCCEACALEFHGVEPKFYDEEECDYEIDDF